MFYLIDKPVGMTSFDIIRILRKKLDTKKMGHIGTLDPLASGLILIATNQSTKLLSFLNSDKKTYHFTVRLDGFSESFDCAEEIQEIDTSHKKILDTSLLREKILSQTEQIPPKFSAIHIDGKRAYTLARKNIDFEIPKRTISVSQVEILHNSLDEISLRLTISSGGYIRSFAPLIGEWSGINGGYISFLRREKLYFGDVILDESIAQNIDHFDKEKYISESTLFPQFLHIFSEDENLKNNLKNGIIPDSIDLNNQKAENNQKILLTFSDYSSLLEYKNWVFSIVRNDIISFSHKTHIG